MKDTDHLVLRTIYLPPTLDERLREVAFHSGVSKNAIMRCAISKFIDLPPDEQEALIESYED
jgi:predicted transcriptional regulator